VGLGGLDREPRRKDEEGERKLHLLLEISPFEGKAKYCLGKAKVDLPFQNAPHCWTGRGAGPVAPPDPSPGKQAARE
jgi:hypothetical protein